MKFLVRAVADDRPLEIVKAFCEVVEDLGREGPFGGREQDLYRILQDYLLPVGPA